MAFAEPQPATVSPRVGSWFPALVLFVVTAAAFALATANGFVNYDDPDYVTRNEHVRAGLTTETVRWALTANAASNWHPLTWLSHALDVSWYGESAAGHHATSVVLHALNAVLAFIALRRLTGAAALSFVVALIFALHPLRVESVAWIAERKDVLSGLFFFLTLWAYARYAERRATPPLRATLDPTGRAGTSLPASDGEARRGAESAPYPAVTGRTAIWYVAALAFFALGLLSKPMLVTLPCVLLLLDYWPLKRLRLDQGRGRLPPPSGHDFANDAGDTTEDRIRDGGMRRSRPTIATLLLEKLPFVALSIASACITYVVQKHGGAVTDQLPATGRLGNALVAIPRYVGKVVWPTRLSALYPHPGFWSGAAIALAAVFIVTVTVVVIANGRARPWLAVGWLWFVGMLVPVIGLVQVGLQSIADRYTYLPAIGLTLAIVWTLAEVLGARRAAIFGGVGVALPLAVATVHQITVWRDSLTLFTQAVAVAGKGNYLAYDNRGIAWADRGDFNAAIADYEQSLAINPRYFNAHNNLGLALNKLGRNAEAIAQYREAVREKPTELEPHNNLANALSDVGQLDDALAEFRYVLERSPNHVNALNGEAVIYAQRGDMPRAEQQFKRVLAADPTSTGALTNLGNVYAMTGRREDAARVFGQALERKPDDPVVLFNLGQLYLQLGRASDAVEKLTAAARLNPRNADAHLALATALAQVGRTADARSEAETCLQLRPKYPPAEALLSKLR